MYFYMTAGLILFRCIEIGFYKTLSSLYQLTNNNNNNNNNNDIRGFRTVTLIGCSKATTKAFQPKF